MTSAVRPIERSRNPFPRTATAPQTHGVQHYPNLPAISTSTT
ncbi:hypothetical protein [Nocardia aurantiaca]|nr:hypothetical protein [Nocardia aurantiaca]